MLAGAMGTWPRKMPTIVNRRPAAPKTRPILIGSDTLRCEEESGGEDTGCDCVSRFMLYSILHEQNDQV